MDESRRLESVQELKLLDTPAEERFDRLTRMARRSLRAPFAFLTLVDRDRQWFKSAQGTTVVESPREISFCAHTIRSDAPLVISDLTQDPAHAANPVVTGDPCVRFYAGVPLKGKDGARVGTLCVLDTRPRDLDDDELESLKDLAGCAETELQMLTWSATEAELLASRSPVGLVDPDSRAWSREAVEDLLGREMKRSAQHQRPLTLISLEFAGEVREAADRVRSLLPPYHLLGRWGEREFAVVAPECGHDQAVALSRRLLSEAPGRAAVVEVTSGETPAAVLERAHQLVLAAAPGAVGLDSGSRQLRAYCLGKFELFVGDQLVSDAKFRSNKHRYLLAYLLDSPDHRANDDVLLDLFWPDAADEPGRKCLSSGLSCLRGILRPEGNPLDPLLREREHIRLNPQLNLWCDVNELAAQGKRALAAGDAVGLLQALRLYRGPFLEGNFDDWALLRREAHEQLYCQFALKAAELFYGEGKYAECLECAEGILRVAPQRQDALALAMRAWLKEGRYEMAIDRFRQFEKVASREYGIEPGIELFELFQRAKLSVG